MRILLLFIFLSGCAAVPPQKDLNSLRAAIEPGDVYTLAYYVAQRIPYERQPRWLDADTVLAIGHGDCKGKAAVACGVIAAWDGWAGWYYYPHPWHVVCRFYNFKDGSSGWIDDNVIWE